MLLFIGSALALFLCLRWGFGGVCGFSRVAAGYGGQPLNPKAQPPKAPKLRV